MKKFLSIIICIAILSTCFASCAVSDTISIENHKVKTDASEIFLSGENVSDISKIKKLKNLKKITMSQTSVSDLSPLAETDVEEVELITADFLSDISPLAEMKNLKALTINGCIKILDFSVLENAQGLEKLTIIDSGIYNIDFLKNFENLKSLELKAKGVRDVSVISEMISLEKLSQTGDLQHHLGAEQ